MKPEADDRLIHITELVSAVAVSVTGVFLLLAGLGVFPFTVGQCWLMAVYTCMVFIALFVAISQKNSIAIFFSWVIGALIVAKVMMLSGFSARNIYPLYIIAIPLGVANGAMFTRYAAKTIKACLAVVGVGLILLLESTTLLPLSVVLPIVAIYLGVLGAIYAATRLRKNKIHKENK